MSKIITYDKSDRNVQQNHIKKFNEIKFKNDTLTFTPGAKNINKNLLNDIKFGSNVELKTTAFVPTTFLELKFSYHFNAHHKT